MLSFNNTAPSSHERVNINQALVVHNLQTSLFYLIIPTIQVVLELIRRIRQVVDTAKYLYKSAYPTISNLSPTILHFSKEQTS